MRRLLRRCARRWAIALLDRAHGRPAQRTSVEDEPDPELVGTVTLRLIRPGDEDFEDLPLW